MWLRRQGKVGGWAGIHTQARTVSMYEWFCGSFNTVLRHSLDDAADGAKADSRDGAGRTEHARQLRIRHHFATLRLIPDVPRKVDRVVLSRIGDSVKDGPAYVSLVHSGLSGSKSTRRVCFARTSKERLIVAFGFKLCSRRGQSGDGSGKYPKRRRKVPVTRVRLPLAASAKTGRSHGLAVGAEAGKERAA
ncbi:uncharacterized protein PV09_04180 [Verruconis gallopava]|uniref:Uncharacterized protein n=1 Tax=Verruconis gallopava TaxID=253628 RepID=A0A0D2AF11_9PEZI|nr:uncharacterized protein PV09_04180 [Verruconis gallopava]KIW05025.1 hypothetical protein PV09_04180 [Verruconis gallopava]